MKYFLFIFALMCIGLLQCKKDDITCPEGLQEAVIIGADYRFCACCGGWFIDLGKDTVRTFTLPDGFVIDQLSDLPIEVCLSYHKEPAGPCQDYDHLIVVDKINRR